MFLRRVGLGKAPGEKAAGLLQTVETQRGFGTLMEHDANLITARISVASNRVLKGRNLVCFGGN
jgi:hypothetical protein